MTESRHQRAKIFKVGLMSCALLLSACATTGGSNPVEGSSAEISGNKATAKLASATPAPNFEETLALSGIDVSQTHAAGPMSCPDSIGGVGFQKIVNFNANANNVGCLYEGESQFYSLYAYDQLGRGVLPQLKGVMSAVMTVKKEWQLRYDEELSKTCALGGLMLSVDEGNDDEQVKVNLHPQEPAGTIDGYDYAIGVMRGPSVMSIAAIHSREDVFFKIRASSLNDGGFTEGQIIEECLRVADIMRAMDTSFDASKLIGVGGADSKI